MYLSQAAVPTVVNDIIRTNPKTAQSQVIVLDVGRASVTKDNHEVRTVKVADKSGSVNLSLWDEPGKQVQSGASVSWRRLNGFCCPECAPRSSSGDIIRLSKCYTNTWKGCLTLYISKTGEIFKVGDFCLIFSEMPFMR